MKKNLIWLFKELDRWVLEGIITESQADRIRSRYPTEDQAGSWGRIAFVVAGAVLIGLGVILLFAYNWEKMHRFAKLGVIFAALIGTHAAGFVVRRQAARETLHALGTMLFGAGIWLVAQIYHINEHFPNGILLWGLGALSLAWILPSLSQALLATVLFALWHGFEVMTFHSPNYAAIAIILLGCLPLARVLRSRIVASVVLATFFFVLFTVFQHTQEQLVLPVFFSVAASLVAIGMILRRSEGAPELASVCFAYGNIFYVLLAFFLSFREARDLYWQLARGDNPGNIWFSALLVLALGLWLAVFWPLKKGRVALPDDFRLDSLAAPMALVLYSLQFFGILKLHGWDATAPYNLLLLFTAIALMYRGYRTLHIRSAAMGGLLLAVLAVARYTDLFHSLLARALVFMVVGGLMLGIGIFFARARKTAREGEQ